jgi:hypothetical protein
VAVPSASCSTKLLLARHGRNTFQRTTIRSSNIGFGNRLENHYQIREIKSVRYCPWRHTFFERLIGSCRREFTDHILFWSESDLLAKLSVFQEYFNSYRVHYSHAGKTPAEMNGKRHLASLDVKNFKWKPVCGGMYYTPIAA